MVKQYNSHFKFNNACGITLLELSITLLIFVIMLSFAIPAFIRMLSDSEARRTRNTLINTINTAKTTSYAQHQRVFMCLLDKNDTCDKNADEYLLLFYDKNQNKKYDVGIDRIITKRFLNLKYAQVKMRAGGRDYVRFAADSGTPRGFFGHFKYCPIKENNNYKFQISFNQVGNIRYKPNKNHPTNC